MFLLLSACSTFRVQTKFFSLPHQVTLSNEPNEHTRGTSRSDFYAIGDEKGVITISPLFFIAIIIFAADSGILVLLDVFIFASRNATPANSILDDQAI